MRGRKPKPAAQALVDGDTRKIGANKLKAKLASEPAAEKGLPNCPSHLKALARDAWESWSQDLQDMDMDRRPDAQMLEGACVAYARAVQADSMLAREGIVCRSWGVIKTVDKGGNPIQRRVLLKMKAHPANAISNNSWRQVRAFCSEFGLSPVSRTRLSIEKKGGELEDLEKILSKPRERKQPANPLAQSTPPVIQ